VESININISKDHLKLSVDKLPDVLLLPGDPARVYEIGRFLDNVKEVGNNRDYLTIVGEYRGLPIAACSSGMGGPSTEIAVVELHKHGVNTIIRIGTSGGLSEKISPGDLIVLSGCIKYSGTANLFVPENFPSIADYRVLQALICACDREGATFHVGLGLSVDSFYATKPGLIGNDFPSTINDQMDLWKSAGALQLDMEAATLFVLSSLLGISAGAICTAGSNIIKGLRPEYPPSNDPAIRCACEAALLFKRWERLSEQAGKNFLIPPIEDRGKI